MRVGNEKSGKRKELRGGVGIFFGSEAVEKHGPTGWEESRNGRLKLS